MIKTNLILIDGIPGSGKSTTAQLLCLNLRKQGYQARWIYEQEMPHPIYDPEELAQAMEIGFPKAHAIHDRALSNWKNLVLSLKETREIVIMDGLLFQTTLGSLLLGGEDRKKSIDYILSIQNVIHDLNPVFIYLYQKDIAKALRWICNRRGQAFEALLIHKIANTFYGRKHGIYDFTDVVEFFQDVKEIIDFLFSALRMPKISIETDSTGNRQRYYKEISTFLSITDLQETVPPRNPLTAFVGLYKALEADEELAIATDGKHLFIDNLFQTRLIHKKENTFYVEGTHSTLSFETDKGNFIKKMVYQVDRSYSNVWTRISL